MVTPVHRFQSVECGIGSGNVNGNSGRFYHPRSLTLHHHQSYLTRSNILHDPHHYHRHTGALGGSNILVDFTTRRRSPATATYLFSPNSKLKCGIWASFAVVTVFMAGANFYFNHKTTGMEILIFCAFLVIVIFAGCTVSLCDTNPTPLHTPLHTVHIADTIQQLSAPNQSSTEILTRMNERRERRQQQQLEGALTTPTPATLSSQPPPPPYHIAVLLPKRQQSLNDESPPPAYDKITTT